MERNSMIENDNVYYRARKEAARYNEKLNSREGAAEALGVSPSTLAHYELGTVKQIPVDQVVMMADLYHCPELEKKYCKYECPIGCRMPMASEAEVIERAVLSLCRDMDDKEIEEIKDRWIDIASDGIIDKSEQAAANELLEKLDKISLAIDRVKLSCRSCMRG